MEMSENDHQVEGSRTASTSPQDNVLTDSEKGSGMLAESTTTSSQPTATTASIVEQVESPPGPAVANGSDATNNGEVKPNPGKMIMIGGGSERRLSGLRPKVALRKRGLSFKETRQVCVLEDETGIRQLNQYTFLEELGRGAYGIVMKAEANDTKEVLAIKTIDKKALKKVRIGRFGNALQNVKKELNIWKRFKHRHIVELREVIDSDVSLSKEAQSWTEKSIAHR